MSSPQDTQAPADWIQRFAACIPTRAHVLDLACGSGRHTRFLLARGHRVTAVDRDVSGLHDLIHEPNLTLMQADLENGPWPFTQRQFDAAVVCNYLHRPLLRAIGRVVAPGGVLLYTTFAHGNARYGHPRNPNFLLQDNELLLFANAGFTIHAFEHGYVDTPRPALRQSLYAVRHRS